MAIVKVEFELDTEQDNILINELIRAVSACMTPQPEVGENTGTTSPVASSGVPLQEDGGVSAGEDKVVEQVTDASPALSDKPKRTRKPKDEPAPEVVEPEVIPEEAYVEEPSPVVEAPTFTLDDVRSALQAYTQQKSIEDGLALLKSFKAGRISELAEADYGAFIEAAKV